jgi:hypothetical protein
MIKLKHAIILVVGALLTVAGMYLQRQGHEGGGFLKGAGIGCLLLFAYLFYKHLKSNNETASK